MIMYRAFLNITEWTLDFDGYFKTYGLIKCSRSILSPSWLNIRAILNIFPVFWNLEIKLNSLFVSFYLV